MWKKICCPTLPGSYLAFGSRNKNAKICLYSDPSWFLKGSYWFINCKGERKSATRPNWFLFGFGSRNYNAKICLDPDPTWFKKGSCWLINCKYEMKSAARSYLIPNWHLDPGIQMQKYVWTRILHGFWKAVVDLWIVKVKENLLPGPTWFLFGIWILEIKCKTMLGPGSFMVSKRQLLTHKL